MQDKLTRNSTYLSSSRSSPNHRQTVHLLATPDVSPWSRTTPSPETWAQNPWTGACVSDPSPTRTHRATVDIDAVRVCHWIPWRRASGTMLVSKRKADRLAGSVPLPAQQWSRYLAVSWTVLCFVLWNGLGGQGQDTGQLPVPSRLCFVAPKTSGLGTLTDVLESLIPFFSSGGCQELATTGLVFGFCNGL